MFKDFDGDRYRCDGCRLYMSDHGNHAYVKFVCYDTVENKYVYLVPVKNYTLEDMTKMFKRFDVVMGRGIDGIEVSDDDWIDLEWLAPYMQRFILGITLIIYGYRVSKHK